MWSTQDLLLWRLYLKEISCGRAVWVSAAGHLSSWAGGRTNSSYRGIGLLLRLPLRQHYWNHLSAYVAAVPESWAASGRHRSDNKSSRDTRAITSRYSIPVAAAIRSEKSDMSGACLNPSSAAFPTCYGVVWLQSSPSPWTVGQECFRFAHVSEQPLGWLCMEASGNLLPRAPDTLLFWLTCLCWSPLEKCLHSKQVEQILICLEWALPLNVKLTFSREIYLIVLSEAPL